MKVRQPGQSSESVFSGQLVHQESPILFQFPGTNSATVGRDGGLQGQSPPPHPICSSRRAYIPAAVPEVCNFQAGHQRFRAFSAGGLQFLSRPPAFLGLQCRRSAIFEQTTIDFDPLVLPVCIFLTDRDRFWPAGVGDKRKYAYYSAA